MPRLPIVGGDNNVWGDVLVEYLTVSIEADGTLKSSAVEAAGDGIFATVPTVSSRTNSYTPASDRSEVVLANASSNSVGISLPTAAGNKHLYTVKKTDSSANTVVVTTAGSETIDGGASATLRRQYASITLVSDGTDWSVI